MESLSLKIKRLSADDIVAYCLWMCGSGAGRTVVALGSNLVLVWFLLPEEFGQFALVQTTIGLVAGTVNLRTSEIIIRSSSQELDAGGKDTFFSALLIESIMLSLGALCILWLVGLCDLWAGMLLLSVLAGNWVLVVSAYYERSFHYKNLALIESGAHLFSHVLTATGAVLGVGYPVLYVQRLLENIGRLCGLFFVGCKLNFRPIWLFPHDWKVLYRKFRGLWLDGCLENFFERLVILTVGWMAGEKATGYFFQALRLARAPRRLIAPATERMAYNYFSHRVSADRGMHVLRQVLAVQLSLLGLVAIGTFFLASSLVPMLFGSQWEPVALLLQAMVGVIFAVGFWGTLRAFFIARRNTRTFVLLGRGIQCASFAGAVMVILIYHYPPAFTLALGVSVGYIVSSLVLFAFLSKSFS